MNLLALRRRRAPYNRVIIELDPEPDVLRRIAQLHTAFVRIVVSTQLVRVEEADYERGYMRFIVESPPYTPEIAPGSWTVRFEPISSEEIQS